eukprot:TRINITY_DN9895_c0_g3_i1.p1 TRINITY_DN9895_c0_g3~~TRINITY_DN9895_c0_g3_i1.p1  ORF type:complete len:440 (+),score=54.94 TRINITY_DN9895_c0_g3_i1:33-1352(+)
MMQLFYPPTVTRLFASAVRRRFSSVVAATRMQPSRSFHLWTWGSGWRGQLGQNGTYTTPPSTTTATLYRPAKVSILPQVEVQRVHTGLNHAVAITSPREGSHASMYAWGDAQYGRLGTSGQSAEVLFGDVQPYEFETVACGGYHTFASLRVVSKGKADGDGWRSYAWGYNRHGQLGLGDRNNRDTPTEILKLRGKRIISAACGDSFTALITGEGALNMFGCGMDGQFGSTNEDDVLSPCTIHVFSPSEAPLLACGWGHTLVALQQSQQVLSMGSNKHGQCGVGSKSPFVPLSVIPSLDGLLVRQLSCGACLSVALVTPAAAVEGKNDVYIWGSAGDGKLGGGEKEDRVIPHRMDFFTGDRSPLRICAGSDHVLALTKSGLYGWGFGQHAVLGLGAEPHHLRTFSTPQHIDTSCLGPDPSCIIDIQATMDTSIALVAQDR